MKPFLRANPDHWVVPLPLVAADTFMAHAKAGARAPAGVGREDDAVQIEIQARPPATEP